MLLEHIVWYLNVGHTHEVQLLPYCAFREFVFYVKFFIRYNNFIIFCLEKVNTHSRTSSISLFVNSKPH